MIAEASEIFYAKTVWLLNWCCGKGSVIGRGAWSEHIPIDRIWYIRYAEIRHVAFTLTVQNLDSKLLLLASKTEIWNHPTESSARRRRHDVHWLRLTALADVCQWKINKLKRFEVRSVTLIFENLFCSEGCCRTNAIYSLVKDDQIRLGGFFAARGAENREGLQANHSRGSGVGEGAGEDKSSSQEEGREERGERVWRCL